MNIFHYCIFIFGFVFCKNKPILAIHQIKSIPKTGRFQFKTALQNTPFIIEMVSFLFIEKES